LSRVEGEEAFRGVFTGAVQSSEAVFFWAFGPAVDLFHRVYFADFGRQSGLKGSWHDKPMGATGEMM
jgi:hypothetical protein